MSLLNWQKEAEKTNDIKFLIEGSALKSHAEENGAHLEISKNRTEELVSEIRKFPQTRQHFLYKRWTD